MNKIRELWQKNTLNKVIISIVGFVCLPCLICLCIVVIIPTPPTTPAPTAAISTIVEETSSVARIQTISAPTLTPLPTFTEFPSPTTVILSTRTPFQVTENPASAPGAACVPNTTPQTGTVIDVTDGDTIKVRLDADGLVYPVRYIGIDTPESTIQHEAYGKEASQKNTELVLGKIVTLFKDVSETDRYDRLLRYVFVDGLFVNYELVRQGFANAATYPPDVSCADLFREAEAYARDNSLGLWASLPLATATVPGSATQSVIIVTVNKQAEYVDIKNVGSSPVNLNGWTLVSEKGNQACSLGGILEPGQTLRIWAGTNSTGFSCGYNKNIWNNSEPDPAVLYDAQGHEVDRY
ncbi:MAG: thermonuclease family protein [Chloroflexota bacterium]